MKLFGAILFLLPVLHLRSCAVRPLTGSSAQPAPVAPVISPMQDHSSEKESQGKVGLITPASPHAIKKYVEAHKDGEHLSLAKFWQTLSIPLEEWREYDNCKARVFTLGYAGTNPVVMLRLYDDSGWSQGGTRYVFFNPQASSAKGQWKYLGYVDLNEQRYRLPRHQFVSSGGHHWFVVEALSGRGSGYLRYDSLWFEFTREGLKEVLNYLSDLGVSWLAKTPTITVRAKVEGVRSEGRGSRVVVMFSTAFTLPKGENRETPLWAEKQRVTFFREAEQEFHFDSSQSQIREAEYEAMYGGDDLEPSREAVLRYNYKHLEGIALGKDREKKEWLRLYLEGCPAMSEKERLLALLGK